MKNEKADVALLPSKEIILGLIVFVSMMVVMVIGCITAFQIFLFFYIMAVKDVIYWPMVLYLVISIPLVIWYSYLFYNLMESHALEE